MKNTRVLIISDQHFPYSHKDIIPFLKAVKEKYKPDRVINIGDEIDGHSISFHDSDPDLMSPADEMQAAIVGLKNLYKIFPKVSIVESNHGSLVYRRAKKNGIPSGLIKSYREMLEAPPGWTWSKDITLKLSNGCPCYFVHSKGSDILKVSQSMGMSVVSGHLHEKFEIRYWGNQLGLYFGMQVGCLINDDSLAYFYNKLNLKRPIIGVGVIINGLPQLVPMVLKKGGRWVGEL